MYGDPDELRRLAARMRERAGDLYAEAERLAAAADGTPWVSAAGDRMRQRARERAGELRSTARDYIEAAERLVAHAAEVERLLDLIADIERRVRGLIAAAADRVAAAARDLAEGVIDFFTDDDHADRRLVAFATPPSGDRAWLEVPDRLPGVRL